jgi:4-hydroxy-3-polyprenylbenzoate decarboxylase
MAKSPQSMFVGITGASGAPYAVRLVEQLAGAGVRLTLCVSDAGLGVLRHELDLEGTTREQLTAAFLARAAAAAEVYAPDDIESPPASGSSFPDAAVICPCSLATAATIAAGTGRNLIHRAADVALKEGRPLVLVPREMPLSQIHLRRLLEVSRAGAVIVPPMPAFYAHPQSVSDLVDYVVGKVLAVLGFRQDLFEPYRGKRA